MELKSYIEYMKSNKPVNTTINISSIIGKNVDSTVYWTVHTSVFSSLSTVYWSIDYGVRIRL